MSMKSVNRRGDTGGHQAAGLATKEENAASQLSTTQAWCEDWVAIFDTMATKLPSCMRRAVQ